MKHYSCDLCGRVIADERYEARIEISAVQDADSHSAMSLDDDHLDQIADEIMALEDTGQFTLPESGPRKFVFDLCGPCQRRMLRDPLSRQARPHLNFSQN